MVLITDSHRIAFEAWFLAKPEISKHVDEGVNVLEYFIDDSGHHHYCFEEARSALVEWLEKNPEADRDIRDEFTTELAESIKLRRDITLYGYHPGFTTMPMPKPRRSPETEAIYMAGARDAIGTLISMIDDRELNGARWRLTTTEGKVVGFCNPKDEAYLESPGLIVLFHDKINT